MCKVCGSKIQIMIRKGTGICSIFCQKIEEDDISHEEALKYLSGRNTVQALNLFDRIFRQMQEASARKVGRNA